VSFWDRWCVVNKPEALRKSRSFGSAEKRFAQDDSDLKSRNACRFEDRWCVVRNRKLPNDWVPKNNRRSFRLASG
jgi:hypothetical protein